MTHDYKDPTFDWENYDRYRPVYSPDLYRTIFSYHDAEIGKYITALDCGTGSGKVLLQWALRFRNIHAVDFNTAPIADTITKALASDSERGLDSFTLHDGTAEDLSFLPDKSVDFVAAAGAAHWFDRHKWFPEVARVLRRGGTLAIWSHHAVPIDRDMSEELQNLYMGHIMDSLRGLGLVKKEEKRRWWRFGRGRKKSGGKEADKNGQAKEAKKDGEGKEPLVIEKVKGTTKTGQGQEPKKNGEEEDPDAIKEIKKPDVKEDREESDESDEDQEDNTPAPSIQGYIHGVTQGFESFRFPPELFEDVQRVYWNRPAYYGDFPPESLNDRNDMRYRVRFMMKPIDYDGLRGFHRSLSNFEDKWLQQDPGAQAKIDANWARIRGCLDRHGGSKDVYWPCQVVLARRC